VGGGGWFVGAELRSEGQMNYIRDIITALRFAIREGADAYRLKMQILRWRREPFDLSDPGKGKP
jgi:hypothetical protein